MYFNYIPARPHSPAFVVICSVSRVISARVHCEQLLFRYDRMKRLALGDVRSEDSGYITNVTLGGTCTVVIKRSPPQRRRFLDV